MEKIYKDRFYELAVFLEDLKPSKFDYRRIVSRWNKDTTCGTVCCAIGWLPVVFPKKFSWDMSVLRIAQPLLEFFGISRKEAEALFLPNNQEAIGEADLSGNASPKEVASLIRSFVEKK